MIQLAILEDNKLIKNMLTEYFNNQQGFKIVTTAANLDEFKLNWQQQHIDIVICDIGLPGKNGIEATYYIKKMSPKTQVVIHTIFEDADKIFQSLCAGASGYILKSSSLAEIKKSIIDVIEGGACISPKISKKIIQFFQRNNQFKSVDIENKLTSREIEVLSFIQEGLSNKEISEKLFVSIDTIKYHNKNIFLKLQVSSRAELISKFRNPI